MPRIADKFAFFVELAQAQDENHYTDEQLNELMTEHFPGFAGVHMIPAYRRDYNSGKRPAFAAPDSPLLKYDDAGEAIPEGKRVASKAKAGKTEEEDDFDAEVKANSERKAKKAAAAKAPAKAPVKAAPAKAALKVVKKK